MRVLTMDRYEVCALPGEPCKTYYFCSSQYHAFFPCFQLYQQTKYFNLINVSFLTRYYGFIHCCLNRYCVGVQLRLLLSFTRKVSYSYSLLSTGQRRVFDFHLIKFGFIKYACEWSLISVNVCLSLFAALGSGSRERSHYLQNPKWRPSGIFCITTGVSNRMQKKVSYLFVCGV